MSCAPRQSRRGNPARESRRDGAPQSLRTRFGVTPLLKNSSVRRIAPNGSELKRSITPSALSASSSEPPPMSSTTVRPTPMSKCATALRKLSRASSSPSSTRTFRPGARWIAATNAVAFARLAHGARRHGVDALGAELPGERRHALDRFDRGANRRRPRDAGRSRARPPAAAPLSFRRRLEWRLPAKRRRRSGGWSSIRCRSRRRAGVPARAFGVGSGRVRSEEWRTRPMPPASQFNVAYATRSGTGVEYTYSDRWNCVRANAVRTGSDDTPAETPCGSVGKLESRTRPRFSSRQRLSERATRTNDVGSMISTPRRSTRTTRRSLAQPADHDFGARCREIGKESRDVNRHAVRVSLELDLAELHAASRDSYNDKLDGSRSHQPGLRSRASHRLWRESAP